MNKPITLLSAVCLNGRVLDGRYMPGQLPDELIAQLPEDSYIVDEAWEPEAEEPQPEGVVIPTIVVEPVAPHFERAKKSKVE